MLQLVHGRFDPDLRRTNTLELLEALADHDDLLAPHAVYEMGRAAAATGAAFLYSDEALFRKTPQRAHVAHFKPDYATSLGWH